MSSKWDDWVIYGGELPELELPTIEKPQMPNSILVVDKKTGCHFVNNTLYHTDECMCGDYNES